MRKPSLIKRCTKGKGHTGCVALLEQAHRNLQSKKEPKEKRYKIVESPDGKTLEEMANCFIETIIETQYIKDGMLFKETSMSIEGGLKALLDEEKICF